MIDPFNIFGKRKKSKDPFANLFPNQKPLKSLFPKQKPIIPNINLSQKRYLKKTRGVQTRRFYDRDGDRVINGLDCFPFNKKKHNDDELYQQMLQESRSPRYLEHTLKKGQEQQSRRYIKQYPKIEEQESKRFKEERNEEIENRKSGRVYLKKRREMKEELVDNYLDEGHSHIPREKIEQIEREIDKKIDYEDN